MGGQLQGKPLRPLCTEYSQEGEHSGSFEGKRELWVPGWNRREVEGLELGGLKQWGVMIT